MRIGFSNMQKGTATANYSESLIRGVILNSELARISNHSDDTINFNSSCVFFSVAFLEARINEIITNINLSGSSVKGIPAKHWELLKEQEKKLNVKQKWDYISSAYGGKHWHSGHDPFRSFEIIQTLRNELIHYKGEQSLLGTSPHRNINTLLRKFKGNKPNYQLQAFLDAYGEGNQHWLIQLLSSNNFGEWIATAILPFDTMEKTLLTGKALSEADKSKYWMKWDSCLLMSEINCQFDKPENVLSILKKVVCDFSDPISPVILEK